MNTIEELKKRPPYSPAKELDKALRATQDICVGIFKITKYHVFGGQIEPIIRKDDHGFVTIRVGSLLGSSTSTYSDFQDVGEVIMFPEGKTLTQMMKHVGKFSKWYEEFVDKKKKEPKVKTNRIDPRKYTFPSISKGGPLDKMNEQRLLALRDKMNAIISKIDTDMYWTPEEKKEQKWTAESRKAAVLLRLKKFGK